MSTQKKKPAKYNTEAGLDKELLAYREDAEFPMIRHPLVFAVPFFEHADEVTRLNKMLVTKKEQCDKALAAHEWSRFVFLHERPYRVEAFQEVQENLSDRDYWPLLREVWCDSENIFQNAMQWWEMLTTPRQRRTLFTPCEDRPALKKMPEMLHVYRGAQQIEMHGHYLGYSWTLNRDKAEWFATRLHRPSDGLAVIASADVLKEYIVGYINARGEQEIVVEPKELQHLAWESVE